MDCSSISIYVSVDNDIRFKYALSISELNDCLLFPDEEDLKILQSHSNTDGEILEISNKSLPGGLFCMETNALLIKPFIEEMKSSSSYRKGVYNNLSNKLKEHFEQNGQNLNRQIVLNVSLAESYVIDYAWGWRLWRQCHMGLERDCASAWLSTLGGAFSALGDYFDRCAKMALRISMQQIRLSVMGGDPDGVARGWLFLALALSQLGHGNAAFRLLRLAYETPTLDDRHRRMCLGVQAKLKYDRKVRRQKRSEGTLSSGDSLLQVLRSITL